MLGLTSKLAWSNLLKNRALYYPYALVTVLSAALSYIFASLSLNPELANVWGGRGVIAVLNFGTVVVMIAVAVMIFYANSFVMKNRSKEFGVYSILGLEKKHLLLMTLIESLLFAVVTTILGLIIGVALDRLFYALLLKLMQMKVILASVFQWASVATVLGYFAGIFLLICLLNAGKLGLTDSLKMVKNKKQGEKKGRLLWLQTIVGLVVLGTAYYLAQTVNSPVKALGTFFLAVLMVIFATYLLFNAGTISLLNWLKGRKKYYYQPANFISISNLVFRMRKNAMGLATIAILSTMFLVTLIGGSNIFFGGRDHILRQNPNDFIIGIGLSRTEADTQLIEAEAASLMEKLDIPLEKHVTYSYIDEFVTGVSQKEIDLLNEGEELGVDFSDKTGLIYIIDQAAYQQMTGKKLSLDDHQVALYSKQANYQLNQELKVEGQAFQVSQLLSTNPTIGHLPDTTSFLLNQYFVLVVKDLKYVQTGHKQHFYLGFESSLSEEEQIEARDRFMMGLFESELWSRYPSSVHLAYRAYSLHAYFGFAGSLLFIGLILALVFLMATVLVIYYKQISEGYEDRSRFVIMHKVGLDEQETKRSIRKQMVTVFFLPLVFAFLHLAFAYKMLSRILSLMGVANSDLMLQVTIGVCLVYVVTYLLVYNLTSVSYRKIIS